VTAVVGQSFALIKGLGAPMDAKSGEGIQTLVSRGWSIAAVHRERLDISWAKWGFTRIVISLWCLGHNPG